jgi:hypothetical protein
MVRDPTRPDRADDGALRNGVAALDGERAEVHQRGRVAERRLDRHRLSARRHGAGERDHAACRRQHARPGRRAEIDAAVLPARVRMRTVEREGTKDGAVDRPRPRLR